MMPQLIQMRDEPLDRFPPEEFGPAEQHNIVAEITSLREQLTDIAGMDTEASEAMARAAHEDFVAHIDARNAKCTELRTRYEAMLAQVEAWVPPTESHSPLKDFMVNQLNEGLREECDLVGTPLPPCLANWKTDRLETLTRDLDSAEQRLRDEIKLTTWRNAWLKALREAVPYPETPLLSYATTCACGGKLKPAKTYGYDLEPLTKVKAKATGAHCLTCDACEKEIIYEDVREELLDVLMLSVIGSRRRLYPADVAYVRARLGLGIAEFEDRAEIPTEDRSSFPDKHPFSKFEEHAVYIKDIYSDNIRTMAFLSRPEKLWKALKQKWHTSTIINGDHQLYTKESMTNTSNNIKSKLELVIKLRKECEEHMTSWLQFCTKEVIKEGFQHAVKIGIESFTGIEISHHERIRHESPLPSWDFSVWVLCSGGYAITSSEPAVTKLISYEELVKEISVDAQVLWVKHKLPIRTEDGE